MVHEVPADGLSPDSLLTARREEKTRVLDAATTKDQRRARHSE